jgi:hypothetical protein
VVCFLRAATRATISATSTRGTRQARLAKDEVASERPILLNGRPTLQDSASHGVMSMLGIILARGFAAATLIAAVATLLPVDAVAQRPEVGSAPGETIIARFDGVGAQIYECKADSAGRPMWQFREPIATLLAGDKTMGRHYAGPTWSLEDGTTVTGTVTASKPGATPDDIPWLRLAVTSHRGEGPVSMATTVQRINTKGGVLSGACAKVGVFIAVPYSADYVFLR